MFELFLGTFSLFFDLWTPEFLIFDLNIGFYVKISSLGPGSEVPILKSRPKNQEIEKFKIFETFDSKKLGLPEL